jgi:predicted phage terminase large subunit-like protein
LIEDESAAVPDDLINTCMPMLAVSNGEYIQLSTPRGKKGHFWEAWNSQDWEHTSVAVDQIGRISKEFLEIERRNRGSRIFAQEYLCQFLDVAGAGMFKREWFPIVESYPKTAKLVRRWDKASTSEGGDYTAGLLLAEAQGVYYVVDIQHKQNTPGQNEALISQIANLDGITCKVRMEEEGGSSGKDTTDHYQRFVLKGFDFKGVRSTGSKIERAGPVSAAAEAGNIKLVRGAWDIQGFLDELVSFPEGDHDDRVDALSGAFGDLHSSLSSDRFISYSGAMRR